MQGEVYVTVEADASTPNLMLEGSTDASTGGFLNPGTKKYRVHWSVPKGITGVSWPGGMTITPDETTPEFLINLQVSGGFRRASKNDKKRWITHGCCHEI